MRPSVIVVEDEPDLLDSLCGYLATEGFPTRGASDGQALDAAWAYLPADILVLDVNLPGESGFSIASRMHRISPVGIILLTARIETGDRITGLESGADHYLVKPVILPELSATIQSLARRLWHDHPQKMESSRMRNATGAWHFDTVGWRLSAPNGMAVSLTATEWKVLTALSGSAGEIVEDKKILATLGKAALSTNLGSLHSTISRLRRKITKTTGLSSPIKAVHGVGYSFAAPLDC